MNRINLLLIALLLSCNVFSQQFISLWPEGKMPNSKGMSLKHEEARQRITRVAEPGMHVFLTSDGENKQSAVLICPPGGYAKLSYNSAGFQFAKWLNTIGVNAFVLIHRLPTEPDLIEREKGPVQDAQRAMKIIYSKAREWDIDTSKIGIMGASAGGHLASTLGTHFNDYSNIGDSLDNRDFQPNFMILISPVISMGEYTHNGSRRNLLGDNPSDELIQLYSNELQVTKETSPAFIVHAQNDPAVPCFGSMEFYQEMLKNGVVGSLHVFTLGKHSIGLRNNPEETNAWTEVCEHWLNQIGVTTIR